VCSCVEFLQQFAAVDSAALGRSFLMACVVGALRLDVCCVIYIFIAGHFASLAAHQVMKLK